MNLKQLVPEIRALIGKANIQEALSKLKEYLEQQPEKYEVSLNAVIQIQSQFYKTKADESKNLISYENAQISYAKVTQSLLDLLDRLEDGSSEPSALAKKINWKVWIPVSLVLVAGFIAIGIMSRGTVQVQDEEPPPPLLCPKFEPDADFRIMVLPFVPYDKEENNTHKGIVDRLNILSEQYNIFTSVEELDINVKDTRYPAKTRQAEEMGEECDAQLIIWGTTEMPYARSSQTIVRTRFKFLDLSFKKLKIIEETNIDTITSISSIASEGVLTEQIETNLMLIFGLVAHKTNHSDAAIELLSQAKTEDDTSFLVQQMALADNYIRMKQPEAALKTYNGILEVHPEYPLALNNRGMLNFYEKNYAEATEDLSQNIDVQADNVDAWATRGAAYAKLDQLSKAKQDFNQVSKLTPEDPSVKKQIKELDQKIQDKTKSTTSLRRRSPNLSTKVELAENDLELGNYQKSIKGAESILKGDPKNINAYALLIDCYILQKNTAKVEETWKRASRVGISEAEIKGKTKFFTPGVKARILSN